MPSQTEYKIPDDEMVQRRLNYVLVLLVLEICLLIALIAWQFMIIFGGWL